MNTLTYRVECNWRTPVMKDISLIRNQIMHFHMHGYKSAVNTCQNCAGYVHFTKEHQSVAGKANSAWRNNMTESCKMWLHLLNLHITAANLDRQSCVTPTRSTKVFMSTLLQKDICGQRLTKDRLHILWLPWDKLKNVIVHFPVLQYFSACL